MDEVRLSLDDSHLSAAFVDRVGRAVARDGAIFLNVADFPWDLVHAAYAASRSLFALPRERKARYIAPGSGGQRGYDPPGGELLASGLPQPRETFHVGRAEERIDPALLTEFGPNVWPDEDVPGLRSAFGSLFEALDRVALQLLETCSAVLEEPKDFLTDLCGTGDTSLRTIGTCRDPRAAEPGEEVMQTDGHTDFGLFTLLPGATAPGLQFRDAQDRWHDVPSRLGSALLFQAADALSILSNGGIRSAPHRVRVVEPGSTARVSSAFFVQPSPRATISPLPQWVQRSGGVPRYPSLLVSEHLRHRLQAARGGS